MTVSHFPGVADVRSPVVERAAVAVREIATALSEALSAWLREPDAVALRARPLKVLQVT